MPFNGSLYKLESASQPGLQPQDGLSLLQPHDGLSLPHPQDGLSLPQPQDGLLLPHSILQLVSNPQSKAGVGLVLQFELFDELPFWLKLQFILRPKSFGRLKFILFIRSILSVRIDGNYFPY